MRDLFDSLAHHVASLPQEGFDALMRARPDVAEVLFGDVPDGHELQAGVGSVAEALADSDRVGAAVMRLSRPEVQVLMALNSAAEETGGGVSGRFGGLGYADSVRGGAGRVGSLELLRLLSISHGALEVDPRAACETLCGRLVEGARPAAVVEFDRIIGRLTDACLVWPESEDGLLRLHDAVSELLPEPGSEWDVFDPRPPVPEVARWVPVGEVDAEAQAAATVALEGAERLLRCVAAEPVPLLKAGGVGAREVKRLVRVCGLDQEAIRFWLFVAEEGGLVACQGGKLWATPEYDQWVSSEPGQRYAVLFGAWLALPTSVLGPFTPVDGAGRPPAVLADAAFDGVGDHVRTAVLELMTICGAGAAASTQSLAAALLWRMPLLMDPGTLDSECDCGECRRQPTGDMRLGMEAAVAAVATVLAEGGLLGAVALGASAPVVRAVLGGTEPDFASVEVGFAAALTATLPTSAERVRLQGDMTVVAAGLPSAKLTAFFDATADRESAGAATVWRITDGSVRRWLDAGRSAGELRAGLAEFCEDELPQALSYLIEDAARRHGLVDVIAARTVIVAADERLGAELAVLPSLIRLGARRLAETVLVLDAPQREVLNVLRFAGHLPSAHDADGSPTVAVVVSPRASPEWAP